MALSPLQRNLLLYGAPVVAVVGLFVLIRSRSTATSSAGSSTSDGFGVTAATNSPIGTDQMADYENEITSALGTMQGEITGGQTATGTTTVAPAPSPAPTSTAPLSVATPASSFNIYPVGTHVTAAEKIVQAVPVNADGQNGYVDVTNLGGLYGSGVGVSGSMVSATPPPAGFQYSAKVNGSTVYEYGPNGVGAFRID